MVRATIFRMLTIIKFSIGRWHVVLISVKFSYAFDLLLACFSIYGMSTLYS
jgi:hypothetical protein